MQPTRGRHARGKGIRGAIVTFASAAGPSCPGQAMKYDLHDFALRALFLTAGGVAALLLAIKGYGDALPAVAIGGALGAFFAHRTQTSG